MSNSNDLKITEILIHPHCGVTNASRGKPNYQRGAVVERTRTGNTLQARCYGSMPAPYRLMATLANQQIIVSTCSCPVGGGGHCKHLAALLFAWLHEPESFSELEALANLWTPNWSPTRCARSSRVAGGTMAVSTRRPVRSKRSSIRGCPIWRQGTSSIGSQLLCCTSGVDRRGFTPRAPSPPTRGNAV
jgi:hypothetical protein